MKERLQKLLSARGIASRRKAEGMILAGRVSVNGAVAALGDSADADMDDIRIDGKSIPKRRSFVYIMLHKPRGFVTTLSDEKGRRVVTDLVADCGERVYPVGRLDMDSEGLLLLTSDGDFANRLMHPKHQVDKTYHVFVEGYSPEKLINLEKPVALDGYTIQKPTVRLLSVKDTGAKLAVTIHEGRNRQVRRMFEEAGHKVLQLRRVRFGPLELGDLPRGQWRELTPEEERKLMTYL